jgi:glutaryl-CoA dehydrogenase (non-decarboxylating)
MRIELTAQQKSAQAACRAFVEASVKPYVDQYDLEERMPAEIIAEFKQLGYPGTLISPEYGGNAMDMITFGLLNEELGRGCSSLRSLLTVHSMISHIIQRWGSRQQKASFLPRMATGEIFGAFGLTEPAVGSDAKSVQTSATPDGDSYILNGHKKWITFGQIADIFLIFAQCNEKTSAFLVERETPGFSTSPINGMLGTRASMVAELHLNDCRIPKTNLIGGLGFGMAMATSTLDIGRYSVGWGCVGIAQACLEASLAYTSQRQQFQAYLKDHQLIRQMITNMLTNVKAARLLCLQAGYLKDTGDPGSVMDTWIAKYFASTTAMQATLDAVQIHGANGCHISHPVQRYLRDAKCMEIIEGSTQIQQITIAGYAY